MASSPISWTCCSGRISMVAAQATRSCCGIPSSSSRRTGGSRMERGGAESGGVSGTENPRRSILAEAPEGQRSRGDLSGRRGGRAGARSGWEEARGGGREDRGGEQFVECSS